MPADYNAYNVKLPKFAGKIEDEFTIEKKIKSGNIRIDNRIGINENKT